MGLLFIRLLEWGLFLLNRWRVLDEDDDDGDDDDD